MGRKLFLLFGCLGFAGRGLADLPEGSFANTNPGSGAAVFKFQDQVRSVLVLHRFHVEIPCGGDVEGPTDSARWFNRLDRFYGKKTAGVHVVDVGDMDMPYRYKWWVEQTNPRHPVVADPEQRINGLLGPAHDISEVVVINCREQVRYRKTGLLKKSDLAEIREIVDAETADLACSLKK